MGAMLEEVGEILSSMKQIREEKIGSRTYYLGKLDGHEVVLVFSRWGKVAASSTATTLIQNFGIDTLVFTGVAGGVCNSLRVGDVVIGESLYQHDMDARPIFDRFQIPLSETILFKPSKEHVALAKKSAREFIENFTDYIGQEAKEAFSLTNPSIHVGVIATGDLFVQDPLAHDNLKLDNHPVLAVEMEGGAVAQVCEDHEIPYIVIRTISDRADKSAAVDFKAFAEKIASRYSLEIARRCIKEIAG